MNTTYVITTTIAPQNSPNTPIAQTINYVSEHQLRDRPSIRQVLRQNIRSIVVSLFPERIKS